MAIKFGVQIWTEEFDFEGYKKAWCEIEDMGYYSAFNFDHFYPMSNITSQYMLEAWTLLPYLATHTKKLKLGILVACNSYRYPSVLAKIASTVDVISDGRLEFGIGAGWHKPEYDAYGIPFPSAGVRIKQMEEATEIIKRIWTQEKANFEGEYYNIKDLVSYPKPIQKPHPPIIIGGRGNKMLRIAAKYANIASILNCSPEEYIERLDVLKRHCSEIGRNFRDIEKSWHGHVIVGDKDEVKRQALMMKEGSAIKSVQDMSIEDFLARMIIGTPEECINQFQSYIDAGATYFTCHFPFPEDLKPLRIFMEKVAPSFS
ncbi:MAG: TIGR03560 family F420-dependent LLM class oxidoreductase [Candidatus Bathyarchaeota archaeon]|nr:TIGR03560 family F420-dependent LLM class oxidoreductase [Candidatus Bathyarchaeota archaeon]